MPNHITTIIRSEDQVVLDLLAKAANIIPEGSTFQRTFDFNAFIPMPKHSKTFYAEGGVGNEELKKYGKNNWHDWAVVNWGTKWNAYDVNVRLNSKDDPEFDNYIKFDTAWSTPMPVLVAISKFFNEATFWIQYADDFQEIRKMAY